MDANRTRVFQHPNLVCRFVYGRRVTRGVLCHHSPSDDTIGTRAWTRVLESRAALGRVRAGRERQRGLTCHVTFVNQIKVLGLEFLIPGGTNLWVEHFCRSACDSPSVISRCLYLPSTELWRRPGRRNQRLCPEGLRTEAAARLRASRLFFLSCNQRRRFKALIVAAPSRRAGATRPDGRPSRPERREHGNFSTSPP